MNSTDKLIYAMLGLVLIMLVGMMTSSWKVIIYAYVFVIGIAVAIGILKAIKLNPKYIWVPISVTGIYIGLFTLYDYISLTVPVGADIYILGLIPETAVMLLGIWPMSIVVCFLYALTFSWDTFSSRATEEVTSKNDVKVEAVQ